jgi:hypothetical protein
VSIEQQPQSQATEASHASAIDNNEIPTYRAISPQAVLSLICGVLAVLSFAHWVFLISAAAAIVLGILADRKIVRFSDVLTGRGIAQAGVALGLTFGLASITTTLVQNWIRVREATKFANVYAKALNEGSLEDAAWYGRAPFRREGKTPKELYDEMIKATPAPEMIDSELSGLKALKAEVDKPGTDFHFVRIESHGMDKVSPYAAALFEVHRASAGEAHEGESFALVLLKGVTENRKFDWWVESITFPYKPDSYTPPIKKADDGHGHSH